MATLSQPPAADEAITFYTGNLTFDLVVNILCRLPVKVLMKLRCVCKCWNSLISDPNFAKEHLRFSQTLLNRRHLLSCHWDVDPDAGDEFHVCDYRLPSLFNSASTTFSVATQLIHPLCGDFGYIIDSCNGIICLSYSMEEEEEDHNSILVWNPSIRKFKILPPLKIEWPWNAAFRTFGFGYDRVTENYKVVAVCCYEFDRTNYVCKTQVMVHTLGTNTWRSIQSFPSPLPGVQESYSGKFVSGAINWLLRTAPSAWVIVTLDLGNETSQELLLPSFGGADVCTITMGVLRDCLCILAHTDTFVIHVWLMKDYGNKQSWTELFAIPYNNGLIASHPPNLLALARAHYILEDDQLLMDFMGKLIVYNPRNGTGKILEIQYIYSLFHKCVYIESLISP